MSHLGSLVKESLTACKREINSIHVSHRSKDDLVIESALSAIWGCWKTKIVSNSFFKVLGNGDECSFLPRKG